MSLKIVLSPIDSSMRTFPTTTCITIENEPSFEDRLQNVYDRVVNDGITKGSSTDQSWFWVGDVKVVVMSRLPTSFTELLLQTPQVVFPVEMKPGRCRLKAFSASATSVGFQQIFLGNKL